MPQNSAQKSTFYLIFIIQRRKMHLMTWFLEEKNFVAQTLQKLRCFWILGGDPSKKAAPSFAILTHL